MQFIGRLTKALVTVGMIAYAIPMVAWLVARLFMGESAWLVGYMNAVGIWWFAPLLVLLPVALLVQARQGIIVGAVLLLPCLWFYGADFLPKFPRAAPENAPTIRIMTYNALFVNRNFEEVVALIRENDPDVIAAQELGPDMEAAISTALADTHPYKITNAWPDPRGIGLWSRYPMTEGENRTIERWEWWVHEVNIDIQGRPATIFNVHLWPIGTTNPAGFRVALDAQYEQVTELMAMVESETVPVLVVGDFNSSPTNESYRRLKTILDDAWSEVGWGAGFTFPTPGALGQRVPSFLRIDYIMSRGAIRPTSIEVLEGAGSDHLPVVGDFVLE